MTVFERFLTEFPEHEEEVKERAGIFQYDAKMPADFAEKEAVKHLKQKYKLYKQGDLF